MNYIDVIPPTIFQRQKMKGQKVFKKLLYKHGIRLLQSTTGVPEYAW